MLVACRSSTNDVKAHVRAAAVVADAAQNNDVSVLTQLTGNDFVFDLSHPDISFSEYLDSIVDQRPLQKLTAVLEFSPALRLSPLGDGTAQRLWVYPGIAISSPTCWSSDDKKLGLSLGLFSEQELARYEVADAYLGFSVGFTEGGEWVFFVKDRVSLTPPNAKVADDFRCD